MKKTFFLMALLQLFFLAWAQKTDSLLDKYITAKNALVNSDSKATSEAIHALLQAVKNEAAFDGKEALLKATEKLSNADGIDKQRAAFNDVSTIMWKLVKNQDAIQSPVYYQYCPMKKAYWLSREKEIRNPYYGSAMLTCGKVVETKQ